MGEGQGAVGEGVRWRWKGLVSEVDENDEGEDNGGSRQRSQKENASRSGPILTEMTTKGGVPMWSLYNTTPIPPSTTPKPACFREASLLFPTAVLIPTVEPPTP